MRFIDGRKILLTIKTMSHVAQRNDSFKQTGYFANNLVNFTLKLFRIETLFCAIKQCLINKLQIEYLILLIICERIMAFLVSVSEFFFYRTMETYFAAAIILVIA